MGRGKGGSASHSKRTAGVVKTSGLGGSSAMKMDGESELYIDDDLLEGVSHTLAGLSNETINRLRMGNEPVVPAEISEIGRTQPMTEKIYRLVATDLDNDEFTIPDDYAVNLEKDVWQKDWSLPRYQKLNDNEKKAIVAYTSQGYRELNEYLRNLDENMKQLAQEDSPKAWRQQRAANLAKMVNSPKYKFMRQFTTVLMSALSKIIDADKHHPVTLATRGASLDENATEGRLTYDAGFRSSSGTTNKDGYSGLSTQSVMVTNKGADIGNVSCFPTEHEFLIMPGTTFKIDMVAEGSLSGSRTAAGMKRYIAGREYDFERQKPVDAQDTDIAAHLERFAHPDIQRAWEEELKPYTMNQYQADEKIWRLAQKSPKFAAEVEDYLAHSRWAGEFASKYLGRRWEKAEKAMLAKKDPTAIKNYILALDDFKKTGWKEGEKVILEEGSINDILEYADEVYPNKRWKEAEDVILRQGMNSFFLSKVLNYISDHVGGRWHEYEQKLLDTARESSSGYLEAKDLLRYAKSQIDGRWEEAEPLMARNKDVLKEYLGHLALLNIPAPMNLVNIVLGS